MTAIEADILRRNYQDAYAAREPTKTARQVAADCGLTQNEWLAMIRDESFRDTLRDIDLGRIMMARDVIMRSVAAVAANVCNVAMGNRRASMRAADMIFRAAGLYPQAIKVTQNNVTQDNRQTRVVVANEPGVLLQEMGELLATMTEHGVRVGVVDEAGISGGLAP